MLPSELRTEQFDGYPPLARETTQQRITLLRELPLAFLPLLLRELIAYDWKFPVERRELDHQLTYLAALTPEKRREVMQPFVRLQLTPQLETVDWVNAPAQFSEHLTAHLWSSHQIDDFRNASIDYVRGLNASAPAEPLATHRLTIVVLGEGVGDNKYPLFRKLRPQGVHFQNIDSHNGRAVIEQAVVQRAKKFPSEFGHWYIDGSKINGSISGLTQVSYASLSQVRGALLVKMQEAMRQGGAGPEALRSLLAQMKPEDLGMPGTGETGILNRFQLSILTEGAGTQVFSTTFVQWSTREVLRRAQPLTLYARYSPRRHEQSIQELLGKPQPAQTDPHGSLVDADMGSYYTWINQQRLAGAEQSRFLVWFEDHGEALAIAPALPRGTMDKNSIDLKGILSRIG